MAVVNFTVTKPLAERVAKTIQRDGFTSKAEFFRFVTMFYFNHTKPAVEPAIEPMDPDLRASVLALKQALREKFRNKKLPSAREQLAGLL